MVTIRTTQSHPNGLSAAIALVPPRGVCFFDFDIFIRLSNYRRRIQCSVWPDFDDQMESGHFTRKFTIKTDLLRRENGHFEFVNRPIK